MSARLSPWAILFAVITAWHIWRDALADGVIFGLATAVLVTESFRPRLLGTTHRIAVRGAVGLLVGSCLTAFFTVAPRYSPAVKTVVILCGIVAFRMAWFHMHQRPRPALTPRQRTSIHLWLGAATFLLLVEFGAYVGAVVSGSDADYPTITVLLDPVIDHWWGRALFASAWLLGGWALVTTRPGADVGGGDAA